MNIRRNYGYDEGLRDGSGRLMPGLNLYYHKLYVTGMAVSVYHSNWPGPECPSPKDKGFCMMGESFSIADENRAISFLREMEPFVKLSGAEDV